MLKLISLPVVKVAALLLVAVTSSHAAGAAPVDPQVQLNADWAQAQFAAQPLGVAKWQTAPASGATTRTTSILWGEVTERERAAQQRDGATTPTAAQAAAQPAAQAARFPFSFVYDGRPSAEFLSQWTSTVEEESLGDAAHRRTLTLTDPATKLEVKAVATIYQDTPGVDWIIHLTNRGDKDSPILEQINPLDIQIDPALAPTIEPHNQVAVHHLRGSISGYYYDNRDFMPLEDALLRGKRLEFGNANAEWGFSSVHAAPFFTVDWHTGGVVTAVGWSGRWDASVFFDNQGVINLSSGLVGERLRLHPGESIRTPRILQVWYAGDDPLRGNNLFRRTMFQHVLPRTNGELVVPPLACAPEAWRLQNSMTEKDVFAYLDVVKDAGFEVCWIDAYYMQNGWPLGVGNYGQPVEMIWDKQRFPNGMRAVRDRAAELGMKFLLWVAPERAEPGTLIYEQHPDWMLKPADVKATGMIDMGSAEPREYLTQAMADLIQEVGIDCIRFDCGGILGPLQFKDAREPDRTGMADIRYHEGVYKMWDDLLARFPHLYIDNCCGGGTRIDLETCARSLPLWRTDGVGYSMVMWNPIDLNEGAMQNQILTAGLSRYVPFGTSGHIGTSPYLLRSAFNAGLVLCENAVAPEFDVKSLTQGLAECKRTRKYFLGDFYPISEVTNSPADWCVTQYHRAEQGDGLIRAFRRHKSPHGDFTCALYDIDPAAEYEVTFAYGYDPEPPVRMAGAQLQSLTLKIPEMPGSLIVEYRQVRK